MSVSKMQQIVWTLCIILIGRVSDAFQAIPPFASSRSFSTGTGTSFGSSSALNSMNMDLEGFVSTYYPNFYSLIADNEDLWKVLKESPTFTLFLPNDEAMMNTLDDKQVEQLQDPRNKETTDKIGLYHVINEVVTSDELYNSGGFISAAGEVPVTRSTTGGFFGIGAQEDGGVTINGANLIQTAEFSNGLVHEVDGTGFPFSYINN